MKFNVKIDEIKDYVNLSTNKKSAKVENKEFMEWKGTIPIVKKDEVFTSWFIRCSILHGMTPSELIKSEIVFWKSNYEYQMDDLKKIGKNFWKLDIKHLPKDFVKSLKYRGLEFNIRDMQLSTPKRFTQDHLDFNITKEKHQFKHLINENFKYCPECWKKQESQYFRIYWRKPHQLICFDHNTWLIESCMYCNLPIWTTRIQKKFINDYFEYCPNCSESLIIEPVSNPEWIEFQILINDVISLFVEYNLLYSILITVFINIKKYELSNSNKTAYDEIKILYEVSKYFIGEVSKPPIYNLNNNSLRLLKTMLKQIGLPHEFS